MHYHPLGSGFQVSRSNQKKPLSVCNLRQTVSGCFWTGLRIEIVRISISRLTMLNPISVAVAFLDARSFQRKKGVKIVSASSGKNLSAFMVASKSVESVPLVSVLAHRVKNQPVFYSQPSGLQASKSRFSNLLADCSAPW